MIKVKDIKIGMRVHVIGTHPQTDFGQGVVMAEELANDLEIGQIVTKDTQQWRYSHGGRWTIKLDNNPFSYDITQFFGNELYSIKDQESAK